MKWKQKVKLFYINPVDSDCSCFPLPVYVRHICTEQQSSHIYINLKMFNPLNVLFIKTHSCRKYGGCLKWFYLKTNIGIMMS